ncbi:Glutamate dehydrogenase OS=Lysinibacillus sphaericus OX=1421 GN=LS41612_14620 PE=3 SV=1 [Lysinibacillus sphaericus]
MKQLTEFFKCWRILLAAKAANAGGVAVSALEMAQDSSRVFWSFEEVDAKLHQIMKNIYADSKAAADKYGYPGNLVCLATIQSPGFIIVADGVLSEGVN